MKINYFLIKLGFTYVFLLVFSITSFNQSFRSWINLNQAYLLKAKQNINSNSKSSQNQYLNIYTITFFDVFWKYETNKENDLPLIEDAYVLVSSLAFRS